MTNKKKKYLIILVIALAVIVLGGVVYYQSCIVKKPGDMNKVLLSANEKFKEGKYGEAIEDYLKVYENDNSNIDALNGLGKSNLLNGDMETATKYFSMLTSASKSDEKYKKEISEAYISYGNKLVEVNDKKGAIEAYKQSVNFYENPVITKKIIEMCIEAEMLEEAEKYLSKNKDLFASEEDKQTITNFYKKRAKSVGKSDLNKAVEAYYIAHKNGYDIYKDKEYLELEKALANTLLRTGNKIHKSYYAIGDLDGDKINEIVVLSVQYNGKKAPDEAGKELLNKTASFIDVYKIMENGHYDKVASNEFEPPDAEMMAGEKHNSDYSISQFKILQLSKNKKGIVIRSSSYEDYVRLFYLDNKTIKLDKTITNPINSCGNEEILKSNGYINDVSSWMIADIDKNGVYEVGEVKEYDPGSEEREYNWYQLSSKEPLITTAYIHAKMITDIKNKIKIREAVSQINKLLNESLDIKVFGEYEKNGEPYYHLYFWDDAEIHVGVNAKNAKMELLTADKGYIEVFPIEKLIEEYKK